MNRNVPGHYATRNSSWRRLAAATWNAANDPTIYGTLAVEATAALDYVARLSTPARHVTVTHLVTKAIAETLARHPSCNGYVRRGRVYQRDRVDVFVLVAIPGTPGEDSLADLSGVKIERADEKSVVEIAEEIALRANELRHGQDRDLAQTKHLLDVLPWWLLKPALRLVTFAQYELNLDLARLGVPKDTFGAAFVTNVGALGLGYAFPPIVPMTRLSVNVAVGAVEDRPVVEAGKVVARPVLPLTATFDHRVVDGFQAGKLTETFTAILRDPESHLGSAAQNRKSAVSVTTPA